MYVWTFLLQKCKEDSYTPKYTTISLCLKRNKAFSPVLVLFWRSRPEVFLGKGVLKIRSKFIGETPMLKCDFNKVAATLFKYCGLNFIQITLQDGCSPVNLLHMFRTSFLQNTSRRLPLIFVQLASMNVLYSMWHYFWYKFIVTLIFFQWPCCCVLWNKCFGRSPQFKSVFYTTAVCCWHQRCKKLSYFILVTFPQLILFLITFFVFFHFVNAHFCL